MQFTFKYVVQCHLMLCSLVDHKLMSNRLFRVKWLMFQNAFQVMELGSYNYFYHFHLFWINSSILTFILVCVLDCQFYRTEKY